jgi:hypothetical protein
MVFSEFVDLKFSLSSPVVAGIGPRTWCIQGKHNNTKPHSHLRILIFNKFPDNALDAVWRSLLENYALNYLIFLHPLKQTFLFSQRCYMKEVKFDLATEIFNLIINFTLACQNLLIINLTLYSEQNCDEYRRSKYRRCEVLNRS